MLNSRITWLHGQPKTEVVLTGLALVIAVLLGPAVTNRGAEVFAWLGLPFGGLLVLLRPVLGMFSVAATLPLENMAMFGEGVTLTRALGMGVFGLWLLSKLVRRESWQPILTPSVVKATICLLVFMLASALWARDSSLTLVAVFSILSLSLWSLLVADLASSWHLIAWLAKLLVIAALVAAILTIQQYFVGGARRAGGGIAGGVNATAYALVTVVPFAFYLIRAQEGRLWRSLGSLYLTLASVGVAVAFSRTSYVMFTLAVLVQYRERISGRSRRGWLLLLAGVSVIVLSLTPLDLISERFQTIVPYVRSAITGETYEEDSMAFRGFLYRVGFAIFRDHPLIGIGYGSFGRAYAEYQYYVPGGLYFPDAEKSSHSAYLGYLVELGLPGLLLWTVILGIVLHNLIIALSTLSRTKPSMQGFLVQAVTYSFLLQLGYGFARPVHREKLFWLLLGLSVAVRRLAEQSQVLQADADVSSTTVSSSASGVEL